MPKYPLKEMKELLNEIARNHKVIEVSGKKIGNFTQLVIIKYLVMHDKETVYQKDFETVLNIRKSTISGILDTMEKNKIIKRTTKDEKGCGKIVSLSQEAQKYQKEVLKKIMEVENLIIKDIDEKDLETFYKVLTQMKENLKKEGNQNV